MLPMPALFGTLKSLKPVFFAYLSWCARVSATCYYPNGTADSTRGQSPCHTGNGLHSMCCWMDTTDTPTHPAPDSCRSDGLCVPADNQGLWRNTCTDPTWQDPACVKLCITGTSTAPPCDFFLLAISEALADTCVKIPIVG